MRVSCSPNPRTETCVYGKRMRQKNWGIVTARERSAIEYRNVLKERWKMDAEIGKVQRYVHSCLIGPALLVLFQLTWSMVQKSAFTETSIQGWAAETDDGRGRPGQGGAAATAYARGREQAQGGTKESGDRGTKLNLLYYRCVFTFPRTCTTRSVRLSMA